MKKLLLTALLTFAVTGGTATVMTVNPQPAAADPGVIGTVLNGVVRGSGDVADSWSREWQRRDSDHSMGSQILAAHIPNEPFRPAAGAGPGSAGAGVGNRCAFPTGGFGYIAPTPVGTPCSFMFPTGAMSGTVM